MANFIDLLMNQLSGTESAQEISKNLNAETGQVQNAIQQFLPIMAKALGNNLSQQGGLESLFNAVSKDHDGSILDNITAALGGGGSQSSDMGQKILSHVLGPKAYQVAQLLGQSSGLGAEKSSSLMSQMAPLVMGLLGKQTRSMGLGQEGLGQFISSSLNQATQTDPKNMGFIASFLDKDGDGSVTDDLFKMGAKMLFKGWFNGRG